MVNSNLLKSKMVACGMTQKDLAKEIKISENTLSAKLSGHSRFFVDEAEEICRILGISSAEDKQDVFFASNIPKLG